MSEKNVAILGATGAVGHEMLRILYERNFPIAGLKLLSSSRSAGKVVTTPFGEITVAEASDSAFQGMDIILGAVDNETSRKFAPAIRSAGAIYVDNSSAFRLDNDVPLVIPEINPEDARKHKGIIANPNCSTIITLVAVNGLRMLSEIKAIYASTYQAVSGAGAGGPIEMFDQTKAVLECGNIESKVFQHQIAFNLIPQIGSFTDNGYSTEEMKLQNEGRKIMHLPNLHVSCTCVRVPVERSHSISADVITAEPIDLEDAIKAMGSSPGCKLMDGESYPMPIDTSGQDSVYIGRIRRDLVNDCGINLFCCGDQLRKGAATNAVQIAELLL